MFVLTSSKHTKCLVRIKTEFVLLSFLLHHSAVGCYALWSVWSHGWYEIRNIFQKKHPESKFKKKDDAILKHTQLN